MRIAFASPVSPRQTTKSGAAPRWSTCCPHRLQVFRRDNHAAPSPFNQLFGSVHDAPTDGARKQPDEVRALGTAESHAGAIATAHVGALSLLAPESRCWNPRRVPSGLLSQAPYTQLGKVTGNEFASTPTARKQLSAPHFKEMAGTGACCHLGPGRRRPLRAVVRRARSRCSCRPNNEYERDRAGDEQNGW